VCEEVGAKAKVEQEKVRQIQEQGSRLRKQYIEHGKSTKAKLNKELEELMAKTPVRQMATVLAQGELWKAVKNTGLAVARFWIGYIA
jgi:hypothetical protein